MNKYKQPKKKEEPYVKPVVENKDISMLLKEVVVLLKQVIRLYNATV